MISNPFSPASIAAAPDDFFGRSEELGDFERSLGQGSVAIQGPIGIGKSSLLARGRLLMEGFESNHKCESVLAVGDRDVSNIDQAARLVLESFTEIDERQNRVKLKLGPVLEIESGEICRHFAEGRHLAVLKRIVERDYLDRLLAGKNLLIIGVDEADKCPAPLARLFRALLTHTQQQGVRNVRFVFAGVNPFLEEMTREDAGVTRFIYRTITLTPMDLDESTEMVEFKFGRLVDDANKEHIRLEIDPSVIRRMVNFSGGHPHILQLLGSHVVENEMEDPDGIIDAHDFHDALRRICYEDRVAVYNSTIHTLSTADRYDALLTLLGMTEASPLNICSRTFPTRIDAELARDAVDSEDLEWLVNNNVIRYLADEYALIDEFLRIRITFDREQKELEAARKFGEFSLDELRTAEEEIDG